MENAKILLVEDDPNLGNVLKEFLEMRGFSADLSVDGEEGLLNFQENKYDLCILDVMMPKKDGFELAEFIHNQNKDMPIIFITAREKIDDKIKGFSVGGDDYLTKPFSMEELTLRINAVLKRYNAQVVKPGDKQKNKFKLGDFRFDYRHRKLAHPEDPDGFKKLSTKESELLKLLSQHQNQILNREVALKVVWDKDDYYAARSMDVFITKLRKYLKLDPRVEIMNVHGTGYKLIVPDEDEDDDFLNVGAAKSKSAAE